MIKSPKLILYIPILFFMFNCGGPNKEQKQVLDSQARLEKDLEMYKYVSIKELSFIIADVLFSKLPGIITGIPFIASS